MLNILNNLNKKLVTKKIFEYTSPWEEEKFFMDNLKPPQNDVDRAYNKYLCECYTINSRSIIIFRNIVALFFLLYYFVKPNQIVNCEKQYDSLVINGDPRKESSIPYIYKENMIHISIDAPGSLTREDKRFLIYVWRKHPFSFFFLLKTLIKISVYSEGIRKYKPKRILCTSEASFPVAILTNYCENKGIEHINFQHGLLAYKSRIAYSRFSKQLVWEKCFENALKEMHDDSKVFQIVQPEAIRYSSDKTNEVSGRITYYLQEIDRDLLVKLSSLYADFHNHGMKIVFRPHPLFNDIKLIKEYLPNAEIEDLSVITIDESLNKTEYVIARGSTVLYQAKLMNKKVLIDDISMPESFKYMKQRVFSVWFDDVNHYLLSTFCQKI